MSEKISKISVDGVVYDIASTGDIQEQLSALENKVTEEASAREEGDAKLQAAIDELAEKVNSEGADLTELEGKIEKNAADIATVNNNLVEAVNNINKNVADGFSTINGGLNNEIRPELEKAVKYEDTATEQNPGRKTIFLNNHDNICGKTTDGSAVNIAMVSKWNKVDLGSSSVEINLNGSAERPTYNDSKQIALLEDVHGNMETIALVKKDDLTYELQVGDKIAGTINIPADQFLKSVEYSAEDKSLTFVFNTSEGEQTSVVDLSSLVDTYVAGNGIELIENGFSIKLDPSSESYLSVSEAGIKVEGINEIKKNVQEVAANLVTVNENLASSIDAINKKAVKYEDVADSNLPELKAIVLKNGDVILGGNLEGGTSSLVQLNRWGVADFGSSSVPFNINTPKDVRPTVQEAGQSGEEAHKIAYLSDVESSSAQIEEVKAALETKADKADVDSAVENINSALDQKADKIAVDAITEQLATKADAESVDNRFATVNEGLDSKADKIAVDAITEKVDGISADLEAYMSATDTKVSKLEEKIGNVPTKVSELENDANYQSASQVDARIQEVVAAAPEALDTLKELADALGNDPDFAGTVTTELAKKANSIDVYTKEEADAKFITEHQSLEGLATEKFVEEQIAAIPPVDLTPYVSDVAGLSNTLEALNATVQILQSKVDVLTKTNTEVVSVDGSAGELKDSSKDYIVSGSINENAEIVGKSISLKSIKVSDNARLKLNAGDVEAKDLNISGSFPKANGNTVISVNNAEFIVFKDMVFDASEVYNGIEIGLASNSVLPKNILFDNCKFQGKFSNNAILVLGTQDNAIITLNNCYFEKISNALRLSNKSNASGVVVNINNCTVDQWETRAPWQGFLICEDYTNKTEEEVNANNLFGDGKITVNFNNLVHAGVKINPADPASVCGTKNESQVVMVCQDAVAGPEGDYCLSYDAAKFPVVSFK